MRRSPLILGLTAAFCLASVAQAQMTKAPAEVKAGAYKLDASHSKVTWAVTHFGFSSYVGQFPDVNGTMKLDPANLGATELHVTIDTTKIGTLNATLDKNLKAPGFLDTAKFPTASFKSTKVTRTGDTTADIQGELTLKDVTKPVTLKAVFNQAGANPLDKVYSLGFAATTTIKRSAFGVSAYVPAIGDNVTLTIDVEFKAVP
jgi:polyisoprenoid-binding protein YceI